MFRVPGSEFWILNSEIDFRQRIDSWWGIPCENVHFSFFVFSSFRAPDTILYVQLPNSFCDNKATRTPNLNTLQEQYFCAEFSFYFFFTHRRTYVCITHTWCIFLQCMAWHAMKEIKEECDEEIRRLSNSFSCKSLLFVFSVLQRSILNTSCPVGSFISNSNYFHRRVTWEELSAF